MTASGSQWRRWFIAAGIARYDLLGPEDQLPSVHDDVARMVALYCGELGHSHALPELCDSPTGGYLRRRVSDWLASVSRGPTDVVVLYVSGHGAPGPDGRHYLLGRDCDERNLIGRALALEDLYRMLAGADVRRLLVLVDTCYAGQGASDFASVHGLVDASRPPDGLGGAGTYVLAASRRREVAREGAFSRVFAEAVGDPRHGGANQAYLDPRAVIAAVNQRLEREFPGQRAQMHALGVEDDLSPLIPNPRYVPELPTGLDLEAARGLALRTHWDPRSRGVELAAEPGDFFEGRVSVLKMLAEWLARARADDPIRVVTGGPGSGKSAVLARLVMLSAGGGEGRETLRAPPETVPPPSAIAAAVHARNKTVEEIIAELAAALDRAPAELFAVCHSADPPCVLIDALDEAVDPVALVREVVRPLAESRAARLIVATRAHLIPRLLVQPEAIVDLDDDRWFEPADIQRYVERLLTTGHGMASAAYAAAPELARDVARAVRERAARTFLIARLLARSLAHRSAPVSREVAGVLPSSVGDAFETWLDDFGSEKQRIKDLLRPLAYAEGAGLPWEDVWSAVASAIAGADYGDSDIEWTLEHAGAFVIEAREDGRSVYRLFHEALAEHLRPASRWQLNQRSIARALIALVGSGESGPAWREAHPYIRAHLATHAAAGRVIDRLVEDAEFLVAADPSRLLRAFPAAGGLQAARVRRSYRSIAHRLEHEPWSQRASYLELAARRHGADAMAESIVRRHPVRAWSTPWAHWRPAAEHVMVGRHDGRVGALALG